MRAVRTVTQKTFVGKDRANVPIKVDGWRSSSLLCWLIAIAVKINNRKLWGTCAGERTRCTAQPCCAQQRSGGNKNGQREGDERPA
jgi:hypothetical protein